MTKRLLDNMPRTTQMICWSLMRFAPDSPFFRGTDQLKAKHRYYTATEKHRHQPHHSLPEEKRGFCSLLAYKYCTWLYLKVRFSLMGFTGLIWQLKKLKFLHFPRIWTNSLNEDARIQSRRSCETKTKQKSNTGVSFKATIPLANLHTKSMTTWTDDKVWLSFNLNAPKAVNFQYTRTVRTLIREHQIFKKCGNTYHTIQEISTGKKKRGERHSVEQKNLITICPLT